MSPLVINTTVPKPTPDAKTAPPTGAHEHRPGNDTLSAQKRFDVRHPRWHIRVRGELSDGMRKRVGLARALVLEPEILMYDEPAIGLYPLATKNVDDTILSTNERYNVTSVVISRDMTSVFRIADRISMLHERRVLISSEEDEVRDTAIEYVRRFITTSGMSGALPRRNMP